MTPQNHERKAMPDCVSECIQNNPLRRVQAMSLPSQQLLDRAKLGWERFLDSFGGVSDE
ncbi:hypothetical protein ABT213_28255 [Streptomyces sp. NPDC001674]|uniref:hypothetical protein n=1 Tax=Streptomyces sp. NPDC001674 TaxID=3154394 RepID=UPI00331CE9E8